jgi:predicted RNA binding protein YcfA (HicA-like mRNA interferase family)
MKLPRDISGRELAKALSRLDYRIDHQTGSHIRLTTHRGGEHHVTVPAHDPLKVGMLNAILREVGSHARLPREDLLQILFG